MGWSESFNNFHFNGAVSATQLKATSGVLHVVVLNQVGATPAAITISDGTVASSTPIAVITAAANTTVCPISAVYDVRFNIGLVVSGGGAGQDTTITFE